MAYIVNGCLGVLDNNHSRVATTCSRGWCICGGVCLDAAAETTTSPVEACCPVAKPTEQALERSERARRASASSVADENPAPVLQASTHETILTLVGILNEAAAGLLVGARIDCATSVVVLATVGAACGHVDNGAVLHLFAERWLLEQLGAFGTRAEEGGALTASAEAVRDLEEPGAASGEAAAAGIGLEAQIAPEVRLYVHFHQIFLGKRIADDAIKAGAIARHVPPHVALARRSSRRRWAAVHHNRGGTRSHTLVRGRPAGLASGHLRCLAGSHAVAVPIVPVNDLHAALVVVTAEERELQAQVVPAFLVGFGHRHLVLVAELHQ